MHTSYRFSSSSAYQLGSHPCLHRYLTGKYFGGARSCFPFSSTLSAASAQYDCVTCMQQRCGNEKQLACHCTEWYGVSMGGLRISYGVYTGQPGDACLRVVRCLNHVKMSLRKD